MQNLSTSVWKKELKANEGVIIDVRTPEEYNNGFIPNAILIDIQNPTTFTEKIQQLDQSKSYFVYCRSGKRSLLACQVMQNFGYEKLANLEGGILDWDGEIQKP